MILRRLRTAMSGRVTVAAIFCVAFVACTQTGIHSRSGAAMRLTPLPAPTERYETYPIIDALTGHGPKLTPMQRKWAISVAHSRAYSRNVARLRFTLVAHGFKTPLVIYLDKASPGQVDRGGHVIGEACNVYFDPVFHGVSVGTGIECRVMVRYLTTGLRRRPRA